MKTSELAKSVIGGAIEVHRALGPGLLESTYEGCLAHELSLSGISYERQVALPVIYKNEKIDCGYRLDLVVEGEIILELKAVDELHEIHKAQLLTYMKLGKTSQGFPINFNVRRLKEGLKSFLL